MTKAIINKYPYQNYYQKYVEAINKWIEENKKIIYGGSRNE